MNYGELKTEIASDSHRDDLTEEIPGFIRKAEGMIRRELRALSVTVTLGEADRVSDGLYTLPDYLQEIRSLRNTSTTGAALEKVNLSRLRNLSANSDPYWYAERGSSQIEIRGIPATDTEFDLEYLGYPAALSDDTDTNELLTNHETLYTEAALFYLYKFTQDIELAQGALDTFTNTLTKLNEQFGRKFGGASVAGAYNLYGGSSSY